MRRSTFAVLGGCILLLSTAGCRRLEQMYEESVGTKTGSTSISMATVRRPEGIENREAERMIAVARCSREAACAKIRGRGVRAGHEQCERDVAQKIHRDLAAPSCGTTIPKDALEDCLGELGAEDCDGSFDGLTRIAACQSKTLCSR
jgi:hypothetical protein